MKFNTKMPKSLEFYYKLELEKYKVAYTKNNFVNAWHYLERAHIIAQKLPYQHTFVHFKMLLFGFKIKSIREIYGQIPRLIFGGAKSFVDKIPVGNPGGASVPALKAFPIEKDIQEIFRKSGVLY